MIGKLKGIIDEMAEDSLILDVGGVGYHIFVSQRLLASLEGLGTALTLFIETQMREDAIRLFGFLSRTERVWFRLLQQVQGVGARVALALLGTLSATEIADAITLKNVGLLTRAPGVGKKVAERIITELKGKAGLVDPETVSTSFVPGTSQTTRSSAAADALSALENLGYGRDQAGTAIAVAMKQLEEEADTTSLIRAGLRFLSGAG